MCMYVRFFELFRIRLSDSNSPSPLCVFFSVLPHVLHARTVRRIVFTAFLSCASWVASVTVPPFHPLHPSVRARRRGMGAEGERERHSDKCRAHTHAPRGREGERHVKQFAAFIFFLFISLDVVLFALTTTSAHTTHITWRTNVRRMGKRACLHPLDGDASEWSRGASGPTFFSFAWSCCRACMDLCLCGSGRARELRVMGGSPKEPPLPPPKKKNSNTNTRATNALLMHFLFCFSHLPSFVCRCVVVVSCLLMAVCVWCVVCGVWCVFQRLL